MEVDSELEKITIDESDDKNIIVFGKLPQVNIPTAHMGEVIILTLDM